RTCRRKPAWHWCNNTAGGWRSQIEGGFREERRADSANLAAQGKRYAKQFAENYLGRMKPERIAQLCQALSYYSTDEGRETLLRTLLEKDSRREVQGVASLALAQALKRRPEEAPTGGAAMA